MMEPVPNGLDRGFKFSPRFGRTLFDEVSGQAYHVIGMDWAMRRPALALRPLEERAGTYFYDAGIVDKEVRPGAFLDLIVSSGLFCIGRMEGGHAPCPGREVMEGFAQCNECLTQDIPDPRCIFEPHCRDGTCGAPFCQVPHVVYAAVYGKRLKVGMTQLSRVEERGFEQGADAILPLARVADRYSARQLEGWLSSRYRIPQALPSRVLLGNMARRTDPEACGALAAALLDRVRKDHVAMADILKGRGIRVEVMPKEMDGVPIALGPYPGPPVLGSEPRKAGTDIIKGEIVGAKGKWCIMKGEGLSAFRMPDLVGRLIMSGTELGGP